MVDADDNEPSATRHEPWQGGKGADGRPVEEGICKGCGATAHLHEGLCRRCHQLALDERRDDVPEHEDQRKPPPHQAPRVALHGPPVRRRGA
jgi:ribosomal protein L40E